MTDSQKYRMRLIRAHLNYITSTINDIDTMLNSLIAPYENAVQLLCTIPGIERNNAITVISELGTDMTPFSNLYKVDMPEPLKEKQKKKAIKQAKKLLISEGIISES